MPLLVRVRAACLTAAQSRKCEHNIILIWGRRSGIYCLLCHLPRPLQDTGLFRVFSGLFSFFGFSFLLKHIFRHIGKAASGIRFAKGGAERIAHPAQAFGGKGRALPGEMHASPDPALFRRFGRSNIPFLPLNRHERVFQHQ